MAVHDLDLDDCSSSRDEDEYYPEGGSKAWSVVLGAFCASISASGLTNSMGALQAWISSHQLKEYSDSSIGWIFGVYGFFLFFGGVYFGAFIDSHKPILIVLPGSVGMVASLVLLSFSQEYYQIFLSFSVLGGISGSILLMPPVAVVGHWFNVRRGWATGIVFTAGGLGGVLFPLVILFASPQIGFEWSLRIIAIFTAVLCSVACLTLETRLPPKKSGSIIDLKGFKDIKYASTCLATFLVEFAYTIPTTYIASYCLHVGINEKLSYAMIIFFNAGTIFGRLIPGLTADKWGRFNVTAFNCTVCAVLLLIMWLNINNIEPDNIAMVVSFAVLFGFWSGAAISLPPVCISQVCAIQDYGKRVGTTWAVASIGNLISVPIAGTILQYNHGEYHGLIIYGGAVYLAAACAFLVSRGICRGWSVTTKF